MGSLFVEHRHVTLQVGKITGDYKCCLTGSGSISHATPLTMFRPPEVMLRKGVLDAFRVKLNQLS